MHTGSWWYRAKEAEARAILCALKKANDIGFLKARILTDALEVANEINGDEDWMIESLVQDILLISRTFKSISFGHVTRNSNKAAHQLTRLNLDHVRDFEWSEDFPSWISSLVV